MLRGRGRGPLAEASGDVWVLKPGWLLKRETKAEMQRLGSRRWGKSVVVKEERFRERDRESGCETEKPGEEFSAVCAAIKEYDRYKSL